MAGGQCRQLKKTFGGFAAHHTNYILHRQAQIHYFIPLILLTVLRKEPCLWVLFFFPWRIEKYVFCTNLVLLKVFAGFFQKAAGCGAALHIPALFLPSFFSCQNRREKADESFDVITVRE